MPLRQGFVPSAQNACTPHSRRSLRPLIRRAAARCSLLLPAFFGGPSLLLLALSRALPSSGTIFRTFPTRLPLVSRRSQAARRFAPMPLALASSHPPGVFARSTSPFTHRKARLRAEQRFRPSKSCPPDMRSTTKPPLRTPSFLPFFGKKGRPARRGQRPPPPSGGVSPSCRRSGKIAFGNFIWGITSFLPAFDAKSG